MGILASDTFVHPNQSGWPTSSGGQPWSSVRGSGTYNIISDEGVNSANGGAFSIARIGSGIATSTEVLVRCNPADTSSAIGTVARFVNMNNFYYGIFSGGQVQIGKDVSGTFTTLVFETFSYTTSNFYWFRFNLVSTTLKLRVWQDGTTEPTSWTLTTTDSSLSSGGYGLGSDATGNTSFDSLTVTDATLVSLATLAQSTFKVRALLATNTRATWKIRAVLAVLTRSTFSVRAVLASEVHATWKIRAALATVTHSVFKIKSALTNGIHASFKIRSVLGGPSRVRFLIGALQVIRTRATFKINSVVTIAPPATPVTALGRDGVVEARARDGIVVASGRDSNVEARGH